MGSRANLVLVENGVFTVRYDHWAANYLDHILFWGPDTARAFIEQRGELTEEDAWLDECWCEGAALLDLDDRLLLWWGGEEILFDPLLRREQLAMMARNWPGWRIEWAHEGLVSFARYLGLPIEPLFFDGYHESTTAGFKVELDHPRMNEVLFTAVQDGRTSVRRISGHRRNLLHGPAPLEALARTPAGRFEWDPDYYPLDGGLHADFDRKTLHHWWNRPCYAIEQRIAPAWAGWTTTWMQDRFEDHLAMCPPPSPLPRRPRGAYVARVRELVTGFAKRSSTPEPIPGLDTAQALAAAGYAVEVNPDVLITRRRLIDAAEEARALDRLKGTGVGRWFRELVGR